MEPSELALSRRCVARGTVVVAATAALLSASAEAQVPSAFGGEEHYSLTGTCVGATICDVNRDGWPDVIAAESAQSSSAISIWLNDRQGLLILDRRESFPVWVTSMEAADLNGDDVVDVAFSIPNMDGGGGAVGVLQGRSEGGLHAPTFYPAGINASAIQIEDLNRDGLPDLVVAGDDLITTYLGRGDGSFAPRLDTAMQAASWVPPRLLRLADLDRDSCLDAIYSPRGENGFCHLPRSRRRLLLAASRLADGVAWCGSPQ